MRRDVEEGTDNCRKPWPGKGGYATTYQVNFMLQIDQVWTRSQQVKQYEVKTDRIRRTHRQSQERKRQKQQKQSRDVDIATPLADPHGILRVPSQAFTPIVSLCAALRQVAEGKRECLGCLERDELRRFGIVPIRTHPRTAPSENIVRLDTLLVDKPNASEMHLVPTTKARFQVSFEDRLYLAVCLASSLLQLYSTPWIERRWSSQDITFLRQLSADNAPIIHEPFVSKPMSSQDGSCGRTSTTEQKKPCPLFIRNPSVFDLGIVLIELCFCKPLHYFQEADDLKLDGSPNKYTALSIAERLLPKVYREAGMRYGDAVRRCIRCDFDQVNESLEDEGFRQAVYNLVVVPLEENLRDFCGEKILGEV